MNKAPKNSQLTHLLGDGIDVVTLLDTVSAAFKDGVGWGQRRRAGPATSREGRNMDRLAILEHSACRKTRIHSEKVGGRDAECCSDSGDIVPSLDHVGLARGTCTVRIATIGCPGGEPQELVGLQESTGKDIGIQVLEVHTVHIQGRSN